MSNQKRSDERRRAERVLVSEAFSFFLVIPKQSGMSRVYMKDISTTGISFWTDIPQAFEANAKLQIRLYTGPTLYLPLTVKVIRSGNGDVAVEFAGDEPKSVVALQKFLEFLEAASAAAIVDQKA